MKQKNCDAMKSFEKICVMMSENEFPYIGAEAGFSALCSSVGTASGDVDERFRETFGMSGVEVLKALKG